MDHNDVPSFANLSLNIRYYINIDRFFTKKTDPDYTVSTKFYLFYKIKTLNHIPILVNFDILNHFSNIDIATKYSIYICCEILQIVIQFEY